MAEAKRPIDGGHTMMVLMVGTPDQRGQGEGSESILIVEDDRPTRELLAAILTEEAMSFHLTSSGHEAMDFALDHQPSLVVLDMHLPSVQGEAIATALRIQCGQSLPILVMSASNEQAAATRMGAFGYLQKPFEIEDFVAKVRDGLALAQGSRELHRRASEARERLQQTLARQRVAFEAAVAGDCPAIQGRQDPQQDTAAQG
jgi:DNA-binding response OmpR family regulator